MTKRKAFTLVELLVVIAIIALLAAILFPVFVRARENARKAACQSNMKQLGMAFAQYLQDSDGRYPHGQDLTGSPESVAWSGRGSANWNAWVMRPIATSEEPILWAAKIEPYTKNRQIFVCPSAKRQFHYPGDTGATVIGSWKAEAPVYPDAGFVDYGYNYQFLGGGTMYASVCTGTYCRGCQSYNLPAITGCQNCGVAALESQIAAASSTILLIDNSASFRGTTGTSGRPPAFALPDDVYFEGELQEKDPDTGAMHRDSFDPRHNEGLNVLFADGHVKWMKKAAALYVPTAGICSATAFTTTDDKFLWNRE